MNLSVRPAIQTHDPAFSGRTASGRPGCASLTELRFGGDDFAGANRPRVIPDLVPEEPEPMHKVQKALNWVRHAGAFLSMLSTRRAKEKSSARLLDQARVALGDGQLNTGLLRLQEAVDALPAGKGLYQGYENLGRFLTVLAKDQKFLAGATQDEKLYRQARAVDVLNRPNKDGTKPFRTLNYFRALEKTPLDLDGLARKAFDTAAVLFTRSMDADNGEDQASLAGLLERAGKTRQALTAWEKAARLDSVYKNEFQEAKQRLNNNTGQ